MRDEPDAASDGRRWGLCGSCCHHVVIANDRGSRFVQCVRAQADPRFARYPRVPVVACPGYQAHGEPLPSGPASRDA